MRTESESSYYRIFLKNLIDNIIKQTPDEHNSLSELEGTRVSLFYQAPEVLDNTFLAILNILRIYMPLNDDDTKNPQWLKNIRTIWIIACNEKKNGFEVGASTNEIAAPPPS